MAQPCTNEGLGDCSDCGPVSNCCTLDVSGVLVEWASCGGPVPVISGWVTDPLHPGQFTNKAWSVPGKTYTKFTYTIENTECDFVTDPGVMYRWEIANWPKGTTRIFVRDNATNLRTCCGKLCTPGTHPGNSTFPIYGEDIGGGGEAYNSDGTPINPLEPCRGLPIRGLGVRPPFRETIIFNAENDITVLHPCRFTDQGVDSQEICTVRIVAEEYTPAIHRGIITAELDNTPYPAYRKRRYTSRLNPCVVNTVDTDYVGWPDNMQHCDFMDVWGIGSNPNYGAKILVRTSEPGFCSSANEPGPKANYERKFFEGQGLPYFIYDCFNCGERPATIIPPA